MLRLSLRLVSTPALILFLAGFTHAGVRYPMEVAGDGTSNTILLSHRYLIANPDALIAVSQWGWEETGPVSVYYSGAWRIFNSSAAPIPSTARFFVMAFDEDSGFRHYTTAGNTLGPVTTLNDPRLNGNANARPIVTAETTSGPVVAWPFGTWYDAGAGRWKIIIEDNTTPMPIGSSFSVFIPDAGDFSLIHSANSGNINSNFTALDHPSIDHTEPLFVFATQRWAGTYNNAQIGISWLFSYLIGNVDGTAMPEGAAFNVFIINEAVFADDFESADVSEWSSATP